jgi:hypothetical protein
VTALHLLLRPRADAGVGTTDATISYRRSELSGAQPIGVMWTVKQLFSFEPSRVFLTVNDDHTTPIPQSVWVRSEENRGFQIRSIKAAAPWIRLLEIPRDTSPVHAISFEIDPGSSNTQEFTELEIATDNPWQPVIRLPVSLFRKNAADWANELRE